MVLDSKALEWASQHGLDTAALKKAKVPIYGKWYFPDLPADVPLVNLQTGEIETFGAGFRAGAILYVKEEDLKRARLGPYAVPEPAEEAQEQAAEAAGPEPTAVAAAEQPATSSVATAERQGPSRAATVVAAAPPEPSRESDPEGVEHGAGGAHAVAQVIPHEQPHPQSGTYITIAIILAVITAVEVTVYYVQALAPVLVPILLVLSSVKFALVAGFFMHLKFDHKSFLGFFGGGLAIAGTIVVSLIFLFHGVSRAAGGH